jgi:hypothetical protein
MKKENKMSIKVFTMPVNNSGKIEFTKQELEKLLNDVYNDGYKQGESDAKGNYWTWCPTITSTSDSTSNTIKPSITYLNNSDTAIGSTNATADTLEMKVPTTNTSFTINGEKVDLSTFSKSFAEANDAFNRAVNSITRSTRYNNPDRENILAKEIKGL